MTKNSIPMLLMGKKPLIFGKKNNTTSLEKPPLQHYLVTFENIFRLSSVAGRISVPGL